MHACAPPNARPNARSFLLPCSAARTVAALERHAQLLMLRVLLSEPPEQLSSVDATQGLAFLAMLFNVTSVVSPEP